MATASVNFCHPFQACVHENLFNPAVRVKSSTTKVKGNEWKRLCAASSDERTSKYWIHTVDGNFDFQHMIQDLSGNTCSNEYTLPCCHSEHSFSAAYCTPS